ncbi:MAG: hypothetical protein Q3M24_08160 [Candidatus Electrothrix aestuarii]|uniref:Uncharacterized protein n=1 Tax=Candidatus Electrothrix aestuarii TaxID=3062594 RepID=A0AAU8M010_9BACT|nr:hypothetical protein [Candidatus Electrothrix aestuarii]
MGDIYINTGSTDQNIAQGTGAVARQTNYYNTPQASTEEMLNLLAEIRKLLPELPDREQLKLSNAMEEVEMEVKRDKPDGEDIAATLTRAQKVLKAVPGTVAAALPVGKLLGDALIWCSRMGWV